ncbi:thioredoxin family protein [Paenibacillus sp. Leaf72]|uniref:thioredoxin family protein n=1 Tax=Paenibacillus sp. Leaf72 TaxID=1736234 RepID=UPI0006F9A1C8|nr:thioredoxin family protein [Paenibacillus sp. Leaf72]KQN97041.1 hypothetical protein ASF12_23515 [Paenibacillus sp. Leaf72]
MTLKRFIRFIVFYMLFALLILAVLFIVDSKNGENMNQNIEGRESSVVESVLNNKNMAIIKADQFESQDENDYLVYFFSEECSNCREFLPTLETYSIAPEALKIFAVDVSSSDSDGTVKDNLIKGTPTLIRIQNGNETWRSLGKLPMDHIPKRSTD